MRQQATKAAFIVVSLALAAGVPLYAQEHSQHTQTTPAAPARGGGAGMEDSHSVF